MMFTEVLMVHGCHVRLTTRPEVIIELSHPLTPRYFSAPNTSKRIDLKSGLMTKLDLIHDQNCMDLSENRWRNSGTYWSVLGSS